MFVIDEISRIRLLYRLLRGWVCMVHDEADLEDLGMTHESLGCWDRADRVDQERLKERERERARHITI